MSTSISDPYFDVKAEVETSLQTLSLHLSSYLRLPPSTPSSDRSYSLAELKATLDSLENDLEELEESVAAVEEPGVARRLGVGGAEVRERRGFVKRVRGELESARKGIGEEGGGKRWSGGEVRVGMGSYGIRADEAEDEDDVDPVAGFEVQHQSLLIEQQDKTLTDISGTVGMLREQARVMGSEVVDQTMMIEELDHHVDRTGSRLTKAQRKMENFIRDNQNSPSSWFIFILILVLTILLIIIVFF